MNAIQNTPRRSTKSSRKAACSAFCRKVISQIQTTKEAIRDEFHRTLLAPEHLIRLALNEAEALAWQTGVPQLVFPTLAREKVQALTAWDARQQSIRRATGEHILDDQSPAAMRR